nr:retrovirus-related Pol polyprotein from transposon TNT 1-94 [Tanacetum cinerariifolium]
NRTLIEAARTMLIYAQAPLFLWAEAVATACFTQNRSIIRLRHGKTPYEPMHDKKPDLSYFHVFGALCYPTNDGENVRKLQPKADIGIFIGPALHEMTPATISSGLVPKPSSSTSYVPPTRKDWDLLFQPLFDELLNPPPSVDRQTAEVIAPLDEVIPPQNRVIERLNRTLIEAARTMLIYAQAPLFLWAEAVATACFTQNRSIIHFDELTGMASEQCSSGPALQEIASEQSSSGPALQEMTPAIISSGLVPKPSSSTSYVPPTRNDWDLLFQPLFDELLNPPPSVDGQDAKVIAPIDEVIPQNNDDSTGSPH